MRLDEYDEDTVDEYIEAFRGSGPENLPCENTQDTPFDPASLEPAPTPSPTPGDGEGKRDGNRNNGKGDRKRERNTDDS